VDPNLNGNFNYDKMMHVIEIATACMRHSALKRPRMAQVQSDMASTLLLLLSDTMNKLLINSICSIIYLFRNGSIWASSFLTVWIDQFYFFFIDKHSILPLFS